MAISKSRRGSCCSSRNTNRLLVPSPLDLHLGRLLFLALLASCSALAIETTELPEVNEATTIIPAQIEESLPTQTLTNQNDTTTSAHPLESPKADATVPSAFDQSSGSEVQDSFVSVYGGTLEQDIKNDVNSEVEEAPSPAETLKETVSQVAEAAAVETENQETEAAVQNAREPKTLETQETEGKPEPEDQAEPEAVTDNIAVASEQVESRSQDDPDSLSLNENQAITEQPITKTNLLALEQEHKIVEVVSTGTPVPIYEETKHQVTKKQGVEDLLPIEVAPEVVDEPETVREERQFEEHNPNLNEIEDEKATVNTFLKSAGELQEEIEKKTEEEAKAELEKEVEGFAPSQETVVEAADAEDSQPGEQEAILGATEKSVSEDTKSMVEEPKEKEHKEEETKDKELKEEEPEEVEPKEDEPKEEELKEEPVKEEEPNDKEPKEGDPKVEEPKEEELKEEEPKEVEPKEEEPQEEEPKVEEPKEDEPKEVQPKEEEPQEEVYHIDSEEPIIPASPSSTQKPVEEKVPLKTDEESVEDKEEEHESVEEKEKDSPLSETKEDKDNSSSGSSEETHEPAADEAKVSSSDDSTATPLVSYPPHDAGQTFDSNSADEHSAQLSGPSNYRSTLIIALCSGTAVIFIVASLVIFVVSFQRQHGTLDIEMQEQRLGKDDRDEEDAQVKLLEVDLSTPVIVSLGNEETDECL